MKMEGFFIKIDFKINNLFMVILDKLTNSFNVVLRDFSTNRGKIKVKNNINNFNFIFDCLLKTSNKGLTEVKFVSGDEEVELLEWVSYVEENDGILEAKECLIEQLGIDLFETPKQSTYIIEITDLNDERLWYGQLLVMGDDENKQEYKTYKNENIIKI